MVFLETALESKYNPLVILGRNRSLGLSGFVNKFNAEAELLDDLVGAFFSHGCLTFDYFKKNRTTTGLLEIIRFDTPHLGHSNYRALTYVIEGA